VQKAKAACGGGKDNQDVQRGISAKSPPVRSGIPVVGAQVAPFSVPSITRIRGRQSDDAVGRPCGGSEPNGETSAFDVLNEQVVIPADKPAMPVEPADGHPR
jgi:hypothetical protein